MGNYTDDEEVNRLLDTMGIEFDTDLDPDVTAIDVNNWIAEYEAEIDGILKALGYTQIPAEGTRDVVMLRRFVAERTAAKVWSVKYHGNEFPDKVKEWIKGYELFTGSLERGRRGLIDQSPATPQAGVITVGRMTLTSIHPDYRDGKRATE